MKMKHKKKMILMIVLGVLLLQATVFADVDKLSISQIIQQGNDVYLYVSAQSDAGKPVEDVLTADQLSVSLNKNQTIPVQESTVFQALNQGISYIFCIDVSKSVTEQEMQEIKSSIADQVNRMSANDYARIITIGTDITSVCDSTQDKNALHQALSGVNRVDNYTYLFKGLSFALEGQRKRVETMPERAAIIVYTDGMDDSDGSSGEDQVLTDIAETRIPIYVVGVKGNDKSANLNSVGQIARQSGGSVFSYSSMSISEATQTIGDIMNNTYQLHIQPDVSAFESKEQDKWTVTFNPGSYSVVSSQYVYALSMDGVAVAEPTEEPEPTVEPTSTPAPTVTPKPSPTPIPEKSFLTKAKDLVMDNLIIFVAGLFVLIAIIIILVILIQKKRTKQEDSDFEDSSYHEPTLPGGNGYEETLADDDSYEDEETVDDINPFDYDDEETIDGSEDSGVRLEFEITFDGQTQIEQRVLREELILGRGDECDVDVVLHSTTEERKRTSRKHAYILNRPDGLYIKDNSRNKTYLNGLEVVGEMVLRDEDVLQMGKATVKIRIINR